LFRMWFAVRGRELSRLPTAQGGAGAGAAERVRSSPRALAARPSRDAGAGRLALPPLPRTGEHRPSRPAASQRARPRNYAELPGALRVLPRPPRRRACRSGRSLCLSGHCASRHAGARAL